MKPNLDRVSKKTKKLTTVEHVLTTDDVRDTLQKVSAQQQDITDMICVFITRDNTINWTSTEGLSLETAVFMLERVKHLMNIASDGEGAEE